MAKIIFSIFFTFVLAACGTDDEEMNHDEDMNMETESGEEEEMDHEGMDHSSSGEVPDDLIEAEDPAYDEGSNVILEADHMEGMMDAKATIAGAFDTVAYTVSYTPTDGGEEVSDHKWVIHEEIEEAGEEALEPGTEVNLDADHMEGMEGAEAEIDSAEETTVYMVDFTPTNGGEEISNHKWVTESEVTAE
ncbi:YdhK family protein [Alteribacillus sp. HJP-4]|uniref:YdhK family protein n=1 Tax=Alteribacillus sp. HJP-4 TaxID=2775394 RepID=UPI0035CD24E8